MAIKAGLKSLVWLGLVLGMAALLTPPVWSQSAVQPVSVIAMAVNKIHSEGAGKHAQDAEHLQKLIAQDQVGRISDADIDALASLLKDSDRDVRMSATNGLAYIGSPAKRAVPALLAALQRDQIDEIDLRTGPSKMTICNALVILGAVVPVGTCSR